MPKGHRNGPVIDLEKITDRLLNRAEFEIERYCLAVGVSFNDLAAAYASAATARFGPILHGPQQWGVRNHVQRVRVEAESRTYQVELPALEGSSHPQDDGAALEAPGEVQGDRREKVNGLKQFWASLMPKQEAAIMRDKLIVTSKKRLLTPAEKNRLQTFTLKAGNTVAPKAKDMKPRKPPKAAKKNKVALKAANYGWAHMTPEERSAEMRRRQLVAQGKAKPQSKRLSRNKDAAIKTKQDVYVQRSRLRKQGVPESDLPPLPTQDAA